LKAAYEATESQFVAIYGRRRVGKTYLVRQVLGPEFLMEHVGPYNGSFADELEAFHDSLVTWGYSECPRLTSWKQAFGELEKHIRTSKRKRKVIFIDELPWMDTPKSKFLPALGHFWNAFASARNDVVLIVCGSAASWMLKKIVQDKGGLHNRVTDIIFLKPFTLSECAQLAESRSLRMSRMEIADAYMIFGGIPYYWSYLVPKYSLVQNIDRICFAEGGKLTKEFDRLYASLFQDDERHLKIVTALSTIRAGMTRDELIRAMKVTDGGTWTKCIDDLCESGFVRRYAAQGCKNKGTVYQLIDNFTLFHFRFMANRHNADEHYWSLSQDDQSVVVWKGLAFERLCLSHVRQIKMALGIAGVRTEVYAWRHTADETYPWGVQIDLLLERADRVTNVCEMKYSHDAYAITSNYEKKLARKCETYREVAKTRNAVHLTLVAANGIARNAHASQVQSVVTLDDLFAP